MCQRNKFAGQEIGDQCLYSLHLKKLSGNFSKTPTPSPNNSTNLNEQGVIYI